MGGIPNCPIAANDLPVQVIKRSIWAKTSNCHSRDADDSFFRPDVIKTSISALICLFSSELRRLDLNLPMLNNSLIECCRLVADGILQVKRGDIMEKVLRFDLNAAKNQASSGADATSGSKVKILAKLSEQSGPSKCRKAPPSDFPSRPDELPAMSEPDDLIAGVPNFVVDVLMVYFFLCNIINKDELMESTSLSLSDSLGCMWNTGPRIEESATSADFKIQLRLLCFLFHILSSSESITYMINSELAELVFTCFETDNDICPVRSEDLELRFLEAVKKDHKIFPEFRDVIIEFGLSLNVRKLLLQLALRKREYIKYAEISCSTDTLIPPPTGSEEPFDSVKNLSWMANNSNGPIRYPVETIDQLKVQKKNSCEKIMTVANVYVSVLCLLSGCLIGLCVPRGGENVTTNAEMVQQNFAGRVSMTVHDNNCHVKRKLAQLEPLAMADVTQHVDILHFGPAGNAKRGKVVN